MNMSTNWRKIVHEKAQEVLLLSFQSHPILLMGGKCAGYSRHATLPGSDRRKNWSRYVAMLVRENKTEQGITNEKEEN